MYVRYNSILQGGNVPGQMLACQLAAQLRRQIQRGDITLQMRSISQASVGDPQWRRRIAG